VKKGMKGKASRILSLALAFTLALLPVITTQAKEPLVGTMDLEYNLLVPGPQDEIPDWVGTITIDGEEYGMLFFAIGSGKAFDDAWVGKVHFFEEIWAIYDTNFDFTNLIPSIDPTDWECWLPSNDPEELVCARARKMVLGKLYSTALTQIFNCRLNARDKLKQGYLLGLKVRGVGFEPYH